MEGEEDRAASLSSSPASPVSMSWDSLSRAALKQTLYSDAYTLRLHVWTWVSLHDASLP